MLTPKNTCETFCANCSSSTWLALTLPRHLMPLMNPSDSGVGLISSRTNWSYGLFSSERVVEPGGDLLAAAVDVAGAGVVVAQQVVPEREPVVGVRPIFVQQLTDRVVARVRSGIHHENVKLRRRRQQADQVEMDAAQEGRVIDKRGGLDLVPGVIGVDDAVDRMPIAGRWHYAARLQRRDVGAHLEGEARLPAAPWSIQRLNNAISFASRPARPWAACAFRYRRV